MRRGNNFLNDSYGLFAYCKKLSGKPEQNCCDEITEKHRNVHLHHQLLENVDIDDTEQSALYDYVRCALVRCVDPRF